MRDDADDDGLPPMEGCVSLLAAMWGLVRADLIAGGKPGNEALAWLETEAFRRWSAVCFKTAGTGQIAAALREQYGTAYRKG